jgi:glycosyltransferase involved in cell wall biosynthesis
VLYAHSSSGRYGADRQLRLIVSGLDRERYRPLVVLPSEGELADDLRGDGVEVVVRRLSVLRRESLSVGGLSSVALAAALDAAWLGRLARRRGVSLIHSNTSVVLSGAAAAASARLPHVWHVREIYARFAWLWPAYRRILASATALPCISRATAAQFRACDPVRVIHDGIALAGGRVPRGPARATLELDPTAAVVAVVGRISDWKGQDVLVRALAQPPLRDRGTIGLIAGDPWPGAPARAAAVRTLADALGVADRVRLLGFRPDPETVYGAADVIAVPSTAPEPLGGVAIEAAAAGCAVVASNHGGLPEIVRDGRTGRLVPPGDPAALAQTCAELLDDPPLRHRLGAAAARDVHERFAPARLLEAIQALYDELLGGRGRPASR